MCFSKDWFSQSRSGEQPLRNKKNNNATVWAKYVRACSLVGTVSVLAELLPVPEEGDKKYALQVQPVESFSFGFVFSALSVFFVLIITELNLSFLDLKENKHSNSYCMCNDGNNVLTAPRPKVHFNMQIYRLYINILSRRYPFSPVHLPPCCSRLALGFSKKI